MSDNPYIQTLLLAWNEALSSDQNLRASYGAIKTITTDHERIHDGKMLDFTDITTIGAGATTYLLISVNSSDEVHLRNAEFEINVGPCESYLYRDPYIDVNSLGTGFRFKNLNDTVAYTGAASYYAEPYIDVNSLGEVIESGGVVQTTGGFIRTVHGLANSAVVERVLQPGHNYVLAFTNNNGGTGNLRKSVVYYEPLGREE